jgi:hypothetical protein
VTGPTSLFELRRDKATQDIEAPISANNINLDNQSRFCCQAYFFPRLQFQVSLSPPGGLLSKGKIMEELIDMVMTYIPEESKVIVVLFIFVDFMKCFVNYGVF